jgi:hypothetical protein
MPNELFSYMDMMQPMGAPAVQVMNPVTQCFRAPCPNTENAPTPPPTPTPKPKFKPSYVNKGFPLGYDYPQCKTGYVPVWTNARPPDNQSCMDPLEVKWMNDHKIVF